jgi:hypothetical protein
MSNRRKSKGLLISALFIALLGFAPLSNSASNPRIMNLHGADKAQLVAVGWCFGIAFAFVLIYFLRADSK